MHRIVVVPLAAPDKAVALEDLNDPVRDAVVVRNKPIGIAGGGPAPIIGIVGINIYRERIDSFNVDDKTIFDTLRANTRTEIL